MTDDARASWDETWILIAKVLGRLRSRCVRRGVGAVIVGLDQQPVSSTYNGPPRGLQVKGNCSEWCPRAQSNAAGVDYDNCVSAHAEANALARADWSRMQGGTIYCSSAVCYACAKSVANSGITRVVHVVSEDDAHRQPEMVEEFLRSAGLEVVRWEA